MLLITENSSFVLFFFFFNDTATTEIYTLSLHDALPISPTGDSRRPRSAFATCRNRGQDRKSTRLNSSHEWISYAVFCLKKKKKNPRFRPCQNIRTTKYTKSNYDAEY